MNIRILILALAVITSGCAIKKESSTSGDPSLENRFEQELKTGENLIGQRQYQKAEKHILSAVSLAKQFGSRDKRVASSLGDLALIYGARKEYKKAIEALENALTIDRHIYGDEHEFVAYDLNNLGTFYDLIDEHEKARINLEESVKIRNKLANLDPKSQRLLSVSLINLGANCKYRKDFERAVTLTEKAIEISRIAGDDDTAILYTRSLADIYLASGKPEKIEQYIEEKLKTFTPEENKQKGLASKLLLTAGNFYAERNNIEKSDEYFRKALETARVNQGKDSRIVLGITFTLVGNLIKQKKFKAAIPYLQKLIEDDSFSNLEKPTQIDLYKHYAMCLYNSGEKKKSEEITKKVMELQRNAR